MRCSLNAGDTRIIATLDIETTHYDPENGQTVAIGVGFHQLDSPGEEAEYTLLYRDGTGETALIKDAFNEIENSDADLLVSYNGRDFDIEFLQRRLSLLGNPIQTPSLHNQESHLDLLEIRKPEADRLGRKWPKLEECLEAYGYEPARTIWNGSEVTNTRFGDELGPAYLTALDLEATTKQRNLKAVIDHYLTTDLEANIALYNADIGNSFTPVHLGTKAEF
jgi:hypothetical protein